MRALHLTSIATLDPSLLGANGRFCVFDTETSGLGAEHRVIEIAAVEIVDRRLTGREFHAYLNPERSIEAAAERVHGLSARFLADKPKFRDVQADFLGFLADSGELVAHNAPFDIRMLDGEFARLGLPCRMAQRFTIIDTMKLARKLHPGQAASLDALCRRYQVSCAEREASGHHSALADSRILSRLFLAMTAGQVHLAYSEGRAPTPAPLQILERRTRPVLKVVYATPDEERAHSHLCDAIEKSSGGQCGFRGRWVKASERASLPATSPASPAAYVALPSSGDAASAPRIETALALGRAPGGAVGDLAFVPSI